MSREERGGKERARVLLIMYHGKNVTMLSSLEPRNQLSCKSHSNQSKSKAQMIKQNRDFYSFLSSDDAELPKPGGDPNPQKNIVSTIDARSAQVTAERSKPSLSSVRKGPNGLEHQKESASKISTPQKPISSSRVNLLSCDSKRRLDPRKQLQSNKLLSGNNRGLGRPAMPRDLPLKKLSSISGRKVSGGETKTSLPAESKTSTVVKNSILNGQRRPLLKSQTCVISKYVVHKRDIQHSKEGKMLKGRDPSSKFQILNPSKQDFVRPSLVKDRYNKEQKPLVHNSTTSNKILYNKKRKADEEFPDDRCDYRSLIRDMFGRPRHYNDVNDDDDRNMEVSFREIQQEEKRSARIAKKEDDEELAKIEEEERRERLRKQAKLRKKNQH